jgi:hypothetical protein
MLLLTFLQLSHFGASGFEIDFAVVKPCSGSVSFAVCGDHARESRHDQRFLSCHK